MRVLAVVVTYNRCEMLKRCVECLKAQRPACDILVIDNASTDETRQFAQSQRGEGFYYERMAENLGGAGGFHAGIRWGEAQGYDRLWIMDDDCLPSAGALEALLRADERLHGDYGWLSSKCLWTDGEICPMNRQMKTPYRAVESFDAPLIQAQMASFVSLFLTADAVRAYGLPIAEFVIWTDDWEYTRRISRREKCYVAADSVVVHAMKAKTVVNIAQDSPDRLGRYLYFYRNDVVLYRREGLRGWLWLIAKDAWHAAQTVLRGHPGRVRIIAAGFFRGIRFHPVAEGVKSTSKRSRPLC